MFSRKEIFCFCAALPPVSSESISALCTGHNQSIRDRSLHLEDAGRPVSHSVASLYFFHSGRQVLDEQLPQVVQSLQLFGLKRQGEKKEKGKGEPSEPFRAQGRVPGPADELTTVSSSPFRSCRACSRLSCITLHNNIQTVRRETV